MSGVMEQLDQQRRCLGEPNEAAIEESSRVSR